jgi:hypothetical protein
MVVDLAVEDDAVASIVREHRLRSVGSIDDRQACMCQPDRTLQPDTRVVRAAMAKFLGSAYQAVLIDLVIYAAS